MTAIELAIEQLQQGKMIILTDDRNRENEGDLIFPAEIINDKVVNFMIRHGTGIVCLALTREKLQQISSPLLVVDEENTSQHGTPFTMPVDAAEGITTGVSAADRAKTIRVIMEDDVKPTDLVRPGHIFPLQAKPGGVLQRAGHTEGSIDIVKLAGFKSGAVICELMNPDGSMMRGQALIDFAKENDLALLSIGELQSYLKAQNTNRLIAESVLPLEGYGEFAIQVWLGQNHSESVALIKKPIDKEEVCLVRIHSSCCTGDVFGSLRCDCHGQLHQALSEISQRGGVLIYLNQEGRGIGLFNKIKAYALQDKGLDTVEANEKLGFSSDLRHYDEAVRILKGMGLKKIRLLTNNPKKVSALSDAGFDVVREEIIIPILPTNERYLATKRDKLGHWLKGEKK